MHTSHRINSEGVRAHPTERNSLCARDANAHLEAPTTPTNPALSGAPTQLSNKAHCHPSDLSCVDAYAERASQRGLKVPGNSHNNLERITALGGQTVSTDNSPASTPWYQVLRA